LMALVEGARRATGAKAINQARGPRKNRMKSNQTPSEHPDPKKARKSRRFLSADKKYQIFLEAQDNTRPVGEILRREGLYSSDLARIRTQVKEGAIERLQAKPGQKKETISAEAYQMLKEELEEKERALADLSVELAILRKKTSGGSWER
jgi:transposase-like protein